jgi:hypothetical protein
MPKLLLMAEFECHPLWVERDGVKDNVHPSALPLSPPLITALDDWRARWDATYVRDDPMSSDFSSPEEEGAFRQDGKKLLSRLREELGPDWTIEIHLYA